MTSRRSRARLARLHRPSAPSVVAIRPKARPYLAGAAVAVGALALSAIVNRQLAKKAERENPPAGGFVEVDGVRLHYVERGEGKPLVLLHGNGSMIQDFEASGLIALASAKFRVIVFDRPGYGYSERPRSTVWTASAQADLIHKALRQLGIPAATILGHSWGASVAMALALDHPEIVSGLVLASGYYYPTFRPDMAMMSAPAVPVVGDVMRYSVSPLLGRLMWPLLLRKIFGPAPVPEKFDGFPKEMALRPSQIRASAAESILLFANVFETRLRHEDLKMPVVIIAGEDDRLIDIDDHSARLHVEIPQSTLHRIPGSGHMVHQTATKAVLAAIEEAAGAKRGSAKVVPLAA